MRRRFGYLAAAAVLAGGLSIGFAPGTGTAVTATSPTTFSFTGGTQTFTVPDGVTQLTVDAFGAQGGSGGTCTVDSTPICGTPGAGGLGAHSTGTVTVTPGETLTVVVGGHGADGQSLTIDSESEEECSASFPTGGAGGFGGGADGGDGGCPAAAGGGGGGGTMVLRGSTPLLAAAGGGGGSGAGDSEGGPIDGAGGGNSGAAGADGVASDCPGDGGGAGTGAAGGSGGAGGSGCTQVEVPIGSVPSAQFGASQICTGAGADGIDGTDGTATDGGAGGDGGTDEDVMGGGAGGGGGGLFGGGGGGGGGANCQFIASVGGGGGGGTSLATTLVEGVRTGDGGLTITFTSPAAQAVNVAPRFTG
jgi:hypothetical protein